MKILKALVFFLFAAPVHADQMSAWMCLFEKLPVTISDPASSIGDGQLAIQVTSGLDFPVRALAIDFSVASEADGSLVEQSVVIPLPSPLQPGETRGLVAHLGISAEQADKLANNGEIFAEAALANVLDWEERRLVIRENLGPSFRVFWPTQPQSTEVCQRGA